MSRPSLVLRLALVLVATQAYPCTWAEGYFRRVSALTGSVVGARIGPLQDVRWLRQSFARRNSTLRLYQYDDRGRRQEEMLQLKVAHTNSGGHFDFVDLAPGHYRLLVDDSVWGTSDWFDVEVNQQVEQTAAVIIDVSPHFPDCKGGHEFIVRTAGESKLPEVGLIVLRFSLAAVWCVAPLTLIALVIRQWHKAGRAKELANLLPIAVSVLVLAEWAAYVALLAFGFANGSGASYVATRSASWVLLPSLGLVGIALVSRLARGKLALAGLLSFGLWAGSVVIA